MRNRGGWQAFAEWALALALLSVAVIGAASIGMFVLPFALLALALAARRNRAWPEAPTGGLTGVGSICLFVAYVNRAYSPCLEGTIRARVAEGESGSFSCGGFDPLPWLTVGLLLIAVGVVGYLVSKRRPNETGISRPFASMILVAGILLFSVAGCRDIFEPREDILTLDVAASRVPCQGPFPQECFQVRQLPDTTWTLFYDSIEGFDHEVGFEYTIRVTRRAVLNPPADGSSYAYRLLTLLRKVPA